MEKKPIYSKKISAGTRVYYIDAHEDRKGQKYMVLTELPTDSNPNNKKRERIFIHSEKLDEFIGAVNEVASFIKSDGNDTVADN